MRKSVHDASPLFVASKFHVVWPNHAEVVGVVNFEAVYNSQKSDPAKTVPAVVAARPLGSVLS